MDDGKSFWALLIFSSAPERLDPSTAQTNIQVHFAWKTVPSIFDVWTRNRLAHGPTILANI